MEKRQSLSQMVLGELESNMQKIENRPRSHPIHKNKLKMDLELTQSEPKNGP